MTNSFPRPYIPVTQLLTAVMRLGAEHHRAGRYSAARAMYAEVLAMDLRHADALFLLGVLERQAGNLDDARRRLCEAARWAADRTPVDVELRIVERLIQRGKYAEREIAPGWGAMAARHYDRHYDGSALGHTARA